MEGYKHERVVELIIRSTRYVVTGDAVCSQLISSVYAFHCQRQLNTWSCTYRLHSLKNTGTAKIKELQKELRFTAPAPGMLFWRKRMTSLRLNK